MANFVSAGQEIQMNGRVILIVGRLVTGRSASAELFIFLLTYWLDCWLLCLVS